jgi:transcriptional regulator with XRE-family HTH domain
MSAARQRLANQMFAGEPDSIAGARLRKGLSQAGLAELLGTSQSHIAKIEAGKVRMQFATAALLADALSMSLDALRPLIERSTSQPIARPE